MATIYPVSAGRVSNMLTHSRLLLQMQADEREMLRLQDQISTGRSIGVPSQDPRAAGRAFVLQRTIEQKLQISANIDVSLSYLTATDSGLGGVSSLLNEAKAVALGAASTVIPDDERRAAVEQIGSIIDQLMRSANQEFRDRFLFAGSLSENAPFLTKDGTIVYRGNETSLSSFIEIGSLAATNATGQEVFGGLSSQRGVAVDLDPIMTSSTKLSDLRGGLGVRKGSIEISDGARNSVISLDGVESVGDLIRKIEANPPAGRKVTALIEHDRLTLQLDAAGGGNLTVREVGSGTTAAELGIHQPVGVGTSKLVGSDLDPKVTLHSRLNDILGTRASARLTAAGGANDLIIEARSNGAALNGVNVQFVDDGRLQAAAGVSAGSEYVVQSSTGRAAQASLAFSGSGNDLILTGTALDGSLNDVKIEIVSGGAIGDAANVSYDATARTLRIAIDATGATTAQAVTDAVNGHGMFTAAPDASDPVNGAYDPASNISFADVAVVEGNTGNSGGGPGTIFVHVRPGATTASQAIAAWNGNPAVASQFELRLEGKDAPPSGSLEDPGGGAVSLLTATTAGGTGENLDRTSGLQIRLGDQTHTVDLSGAQTVQDVLNRINGATDGVLADLSPDGAGIRVRSRVSGLDFAIGENGGTTATQLGLRTFTASSPLSGFNKGSGVDNQPGTDFTLERNDGVRLEIDLDGAVTVQDVLDRINSHPANVDAGGYITARLAQFGNGIELVDTTPVTGTGLSVQKGNLTSQAAWDLGLVPRGQAAATAPTGSPAQITGSDQNAGEVEGAFNTLLRLKKAVADGSLGEIERLLERINVDLDQINFSRAAVGAREQALDLYKTRLEDEEVHLRSALSLEIDVDLTKAISDMLAKQAAYQASLQMTGQTFKMSLLDYL
ncbi:MAG TPA: flagellin [Pirellulaceae bacterium]|jgi:flagellin-like hook-associated protein FlgL|nr:flagellin [Pirellulaceae bacterium]